MAVAFELPPTAEVKEVDSADLANGGGVEDSQLDNIDNVDNVCIAEPISDTIVEPIADNETTSTTTETIDPELNESIRRWELDCQEAVKQHAISIDQTKEMMIDLDREISHVTEQLKSLKDQKKGSVERLIQLETRGPELPPKPQPKPAKKPSDSSADSVGHEATSTNANATTADVREPNTDDSWRAIPASKILEGIERLGKKKLEAITEAFPTLGHLEDIRGEASKEHLHFSAKLPDGIGKGIADKIEERMMDEIAKFSVGIPIETTAETPVEAISLSVVHPDDNETDEIPPEDIDQETGEVLTADVEYEDVEEFDALADV